MLTERSITNTYTTLNEESLQRQDEEETALTRQEVDASGSF